MVMLDTNHKPEFIPSVVGGVEVRTAGGSSCPPQPQILEGVSEKLCPAGVKAWAYHG